MKYTVASVIFSVVGLQGCQTTTTQPKKDPKRSAEVRTQIAAEYLREGQLDAAKRSLDEALAKESRDATANMMMGVLLQQEGSPLNVQKADGYFKKAIAIDPHDAQIRNNYGRYLYQLGHYNDALKQLNIAASTLGYDQRAMALENLGQAYLRLGDTAHAEEAFDHALDVNRNAYGAMLELAEMNYLKQKITLASRLYDNYVFIVGNKNQSAKGLWAGIRIARAKDDNMAMQVLANQLRALFPNSQEYQRYLQLQYSTEAVWK